MNKNELIIAAAGAGKTTFLVEKALKQKDAEVLITTYTRANKEEIRRKIIKENKCIPDNITVQTWFSVLLQHGAKPYKDYLFEKKINGMTLVQKQSGLKYYNEKSKFPVYYREDEIENHYFDSYSNIYSDKLSKFVYKCNKKSDGAVIDRWSRIYSHIFIDEVQDLAGYDLEIIKLFFESNLNVMLVGDPRQVTYLTHHSRKYGKYKNGAIKAFIQNECKNIDYTIDEDILNVSHRNNEKICNFSSRLYPDYDPCVSNQTDVETHSGIFLVSEEEVGNYLKTYNPVQLRNSKRIKVNEDYKTMNFGAAKGLTFKRVLIYPTKPMAKWLKNKESPLKPTSRSKFYVAITRAKYSVGIVFNYDENTEVEGTNNFTEI